MALEVVSKTPGGEYEETLAIYAKLGILYYVVYNPQFWQRDRQLLLAVYKLVNGAYSLQIGEPFWMPELGLGIGRCSLANDPLEREVLSWFQANGDRYLSEAEAERLRAERLAERLRALGEDA